MSRYTNSLAKACNAGEDLIGRLDPDEGLGLLIVKLEVEPNNVFQLARAAMRAAPDLLLGQGREPAFDLIESGAIGRCVVDLEARVTRQPAPDQLGLVGAVRDWPYP